MTTAGNAPLHLVLQNGSEGVSARVLGFLRSVFTGIECILHPDISTGLAAWQDGRVLVLLDTPVRDVATALSGGETAPAAVQGWREQTETLLGACRKARRHVRLLTWDSLLAGQSESLAVVTKLTGLPVTEGLSVPDQPKTLDDMTLLLADVLLKGDAAAMSLLEELGGLLAGSELPQSGGMIAIDAALEWMRSDALSQTEMRSDMDKMVQEGVLLRQNLAEMTAQLEVLQVAMKAEASDKKLKPLEKKIATQEHQISELSAERDLLAQDLLSVRAQMEELTKAEPAQDVEALAGLEARMKNLMRERDLLQTSLAGAQDELSSGHVAGAEKLVAEQKAQLDTVMADRDRLKQGLADATAQVSDLQAQIKQGRDAADVALRTQIDTLTAERDLLQESLSGMQQQSTWLQDENRQISDQLAGMHMMQISNDALSRRADLAEQSRIMSISSLGAVLLDDGAQLRDLQARLAKAWQQVSEANTALEQHKAEAATKVANMDKALKDSEAAHARALETNKAEAAKILEERDAHIAHLSAEMDKIYGSKSWRVTAPMRSARAKLSKDKS